MRRFGGQGLASRGFREFRAEGVWFCVDVRSCVEASPTRKMTETAPCNPDAYMPEPWRLKPQLRAYRIKPKS